MNTEEIKTATRQWAKNNGDATDSACQSLAEFIATGRTNTTRQLAQLFDSTVRKNPADQDRTARLVLQTLEEVTAARELVTRAWNSKNGNTAGLLFDAAARIDPTIDTAALKVLWDQQRVKTTHDQRKRRGIF